MEPWQLQLRDGRGADAWELFIERYRRLILATIQRLVSSRDDVMDVFAAACEALSESDFARLRKYSERSAQAAAVSTWLVVVVRHITIDWLRQRDGRLRPVMPDGLTELQQLIYAHVCVEGKTHAEAYETIRSRNGTSLRFNEFLREVRATNRCAPCPGALPRLRRQETEITEDISAPAIDPSESADATLRLRTAMAAHPADVRLAIELFVIERMSAADVARIVGWRQPKTVYNKVSRALAAMRADFQRQGIGPRDL